MNRINFNIKDRKLLYGVLSIVLICVFTLSIAYAALSVTLNIQGSAQVTSADWNIHFSNPIVTNGSVTTNVPSLVSATTIDFNTTLNMPGDFYEFTVDVVNEGSIDAIIDEITKEPELTTEQAKYLNYEVSYSDGSSVGEQKKLPKKTTNTIKVRIEFRKDISNSDLPTGQVVLDLSLILDCLQSNDSGSSGGLSSPHVSADGDINEIGTLVTIGSEQFYTIGTEGENVKLLSMYNLHVGYKVTAWETSGWDSPDTELIENATGIQDSSAIGDAPGAKLPLIGITDYTSESYVGDDYENYENSQLKIYVENYKTYLEGYDISIAGARIITKDELTDPNTFACVEEGDCNSEYPWIYSTAYFTSTPSGNDDWQMYGINDGYFSYCPTAFNYYCGVRPVILISKDYF